MECIQKKNPVRRGFNLLGLGCFFYRFLGDTCMTGRGFRDESCSRGLSTVTVEETNVRFLRHRLKKGKKKTKKPHTHLPAFSPVHKPFLALIRDVTSLTTHSSNSQWNQVCFISLHCLFNGWRLLVYWNIHVVILTFVVWLCRFKLIWIFFLLCVCVFGWGVFEPCFSYVVSCFKESCSRESFWIYLLLYAWQVILLPQSVYIKYPSTVNPPINYLHISLVSSPRLLMMNVWM